MKIAAELAWPPVPSGGRPPLDNPADHAGHKSPRLPFAALVAAYSFDAGNPKDSGLSSPATPALSTSDVSGPEGVTEGALPMALRPHNSALPEVAAIRPEIGESGHAFSASALLVATAFDPKTTAPDAEPRITQPKPGAAPNPALPSYDPATTPDARFEMGSSSPVSGLAPTSPPGGRMPGPAIPHKGVSPAAMASPAAASAPSTPGPSEQMQPDSPPAGARTPGTRNRSTPADASGLATAATTLAQFVPLEGGLRLVLRLPRLPDDMRAELEARLHQLLNAFGHARHELLIRQSRRG